MLHLINKGKGGRNFKWVASDTIEWRRLFTVSEDSLTSNVFERLFYLPSRLLWDILCNALYDPSISTLEPALLEYEFWPRWHYEGGIIEPDLFIRFKDFDVIIEAKRYEDGQQRPDQWKKEVTAYHEEFGDQKDVYLIAVGGITRGDEDTMLLPVNDKLVKVLKSRWRLILDQVKSKLDVYYACNNEINHPIQNVLSDLVVAFAIHGFQVGELLRTMPKGISISNSSIAALEIRPTILENIQDKGIQIPK